MHAHCQECVHLRQSHLELAGARCGMSIDAQGTLLMLLPCQAPVGPSRSISGILNQQTTQAILNVH